MLRRKGSLITEEKGFDYTNGNQAGSTVYDTLYQGERSVQHFTGVEVVNDVLSQLEDYESIGTKKLSAKESDQIARDLGTAVVVSEKEILIVHKERKELLSKDSVASITFFTVIPMNKEYETVAYITRNMRLNVMRCHVHTVMTGMGTKIGTRMKEVQTAYQKVAEATLGDPFFAPKNAPRQVPEGRLFNMQIHRGDLKALEVIGAGQFGAVYLATQRMLCCPNFGCDVKKAIDGHLKRHLAVCEYASQDGGDEKPKFESETITRACKMLKGAATPAARKEFFDEANVMLMFDHPNVTNIMGVAVQQAPWLYVLEYCMYGDLRGVLKGYQQKRLMLTVGEILHMCKSVVCGMEHIVSHRLIHMDLAARNCLLGAKNIVKVADFGLTRELKPGQEFSVVTDKHIKLAIKWMAPEVLEKRKFSEKSDVWSTAITMWEIVMYGELPYKGKNNAETQKYVASGQRMPKPATCPDVLWPIIEDAWAQNADDRPRFSTMREVLQMQFKAGNFPPLRDMGALLTDPAVEKKAREEQQRADGMRKTQAAEARRNRDSIAQQILSNKHLWYHPNVPKKIAEKAVKNGPPGSYVIREDKKGEKMILMINENGEVTSFTIKVAPSTSRPGEFKYIFAGKQHTSLHNILGNLKSAPFKGRTGATVTLGEPCSMPIKKSSASALSMQPAQLRQGREKSNPLFDSHN